MGLVRTKSGLRNEHLFFDVDHIIYTEGGKQSLNLSEVLAGRYNQQSPDVTFWRGIFRQFMPKKRIYFKPVGSKVALMEMVAIIQNHKIPGIFVCRDRDFDYAAPPPLVPTCVISTYGYSWENDALNLSSAYRAVLDASSTNDTKDALLHEMQGDFKDLMSSTRWIARRELALSRRGLDSGYRRAIKQYVTCESHKKPKISTGRYLSNGKKYLPSHRIKLRCGPVACHSLRDCPGHVLALYVYHLVRYYLKLRTGINWPLDTIESLLSSRVAELLSTDAALRKHYASSVKNLDW